MDMKSLYLVVPLAPRAGAIIAGLFCRVIPRWVAHTATILGVGVSLLASWQIYQDVQAGNTFDGTVYTWMEAGGLKFEVGFLIDKLTVMMMLVVTSVSLMVHVYTIGYMAEDDGYNRFFSYISLFTFSMLMLVMSNNFVQLFFGWEAARHTIPTRPSDRGAILTQRRRRKMARSAHPYVRGNTERFYEWLQADTQRALPQGPSIWICGDCHVGNLGPVVDGDGRVGVLIRDLDQAVLGNPAHDLIRLGLSLASACRSANLPGAVSVRVVDLLLNGYAKAFKPRPTPVQAPGAIETLLKRAIDRIWKQLVRDHLSHTKPSIPHGARLWPLSRREERAIADAL